ncbi:E3 ubiquitin-protein ligase TRIM33-like isoform X2 [Myzus persicae]|uniref:E3 ubiquitin-protein ligase TRIM33-like isoform X2 n=1 Tax=Myzus persicae TaxID=13164 RepID=UPI000B93920C|nr:E3 ubiquitin-protein ligase TRIM33-like isoform X2 [Myzus persicae]
MHHSVTISLFDFSRVKPVSVFKIMNSDNGINENVDLWSVGKCIFCKGNVEEDAKILNCLHIICEDCTKRESTDLGVRCKCKIVTEGELIDYSIVLPNKSHSKICSEKNCQLIAKKICMHCKSIYCKPCSKTHPIKNVDHNPVLMKSYPLKKEFVSCTQCIKNCVEVFCIICSVMLCPLCHLMFHKEHAFKLLSTVATETKTEFQSLLFDLSKDNNHLDFLLETSDEYIEKLKSEKKKINDKIDECINKLHDEVHKRSNVLKKLLETNATDAVNSIHMNKKVLNGIIKKNEYYYRLTSSVINDNHTIRCITLSKIIKDQMVIARRQVQELPKEKANCKVKLIFNEEQSLKKCVESIRAMGNIISSQIVNLSTFKTTIDSNNVFPALKNDVSS